MCRAMVLALLVSVAVALSAGQLTFSSGWKRAAAPAADPCKPDQALITIYELIKNEAERLISCQK